MMPKTILIIDDDDQFRTALSGVLSDGGYRTVEAANGRAAIVLIEELRESINLMIVDICLPDMNGLEIIGAVTRQPRSVKVIATSAVFDQMFLDVATTVGANVGLKKPARGQRPPAAQWLQAVRGLLGDSEGVERPTGKVVLVTEPDRSLRGYLCSVLQQAGFQTLEAATGDDALALFEKIGGAIDALITQSNMDAMDGKALARAIRVSAPDMPVIYFAERGAAPAELPDPDRRIAFLTNPLAQGALLSALSELMPKAVGGQPGTSQ